MQLVHDFSDSVVKELLILVFQPEICCPYTRPALFCLFYYPIYNRSSRLKSSSFRKSFPLRRLIFVPTRLTSRIVVHCTIIFRPPGRVFHGGLMFYCCCLFFRFYFATRSSSCFAEIWHDFGQLQNLIANISGTD